MADLDPARRTLVAAEFIQPDLDGQVRVLLTCDCGTVTDLTMELDGSITGTGEAAYTCDGCGTSHWFTVTATGGDGGTPSR